MPKNLKYAFLYDCYGEFLGDKQRYAFEMYYCDDLSLSEISEHLGITRQGVRDKIRHAEDELLRLESSLHLYEKLSSIKVIVSQIRTIGGEKDSELQDLCDRLISVIDN